jgi:hypothetical protein
MEEHSFAAAALPWPCEGECGGGERMLTKEEAEERRHDAASVEGPRCQKIA